MYSPRFRRYSICYFPHRFPSTPYVFPDRYLVTSQLVSPLATSRLQPVPLLPHTCPSLHLPNNSSLCWQSSPLVRMSTDHTFPFGKSFHTGFSYYFPMGHGPCGMTNPHGSWSTHRRTTLCTIHDPWGMRMLYDP